MPEPKKTKRSYTAQASTPLDGVRLVQQRPARAAHDENDGLPSSEGRALAPDTAPGPELIRRLIRFIKSI